MKKILLSLFLMLATTSLHALTKRYNDGTFIYSLDTDNLTATVTSPSSKGTERFYTIPSSIMYYDGNTTNVYKVTAIGNSAFSSDERINSVTIGDEVITIGTSAFNGCTNLSSVRLGDKVETIGISAFRDCAKIESFTFSNSVTTILSSAFSGCIKLASITIPDHIQNLERQVFMDCTGLKTVVLGSGIKNISPYVFSGCTALTSITGDNVETIDNRAFNGCTALTTLAFPDKLKNIGEFAFRDCTALTTVAFPDNLKIIGSHAFYGCAKLSTINWGEGVEEIGDHAFVGCKSLTSVTFPNSLKTIKNDAFWYLEDLASVTFGSGLESIAEFAFGYTGITALNMPASLKEVDGRAFTNCAIESISISNDNGIFNCPDNCNALIEKNTNTLVLGCKNTIIPSTVIRLGKKCFYSCNLTSPFSLPSGLVSIGDSAFYGCKLTSIAIPDGVTSIGNAAFLGNPLKVITLGNELTTIGKYAFHACKLTAVTFGPKVKSIGYKAFYENKMASLVIPGNVESIGAEAFIHSDIVNLTLENGIKDIGKGAFNNTKIERIVLPKSVTTYQQAFCQCSSLKSLSVEEGNPNYDSRNNCNAIMETSTNRLLSGCRNSVIPKETNAIGAKAFYGTYYLKTAVIPNKVTDIGDSAFYYCTYLASATIGKKVGTIGKNAFASNSNLLTVKCLAKEIPQTIKQYGADYTFNSNMSGATLYVPSDMVAAYSAASPWSNFGSIKELKESVTIGSAGVATYCSIYDLDFSEVEGLKAFIVSAYRPSTAEVTMSRIKDVPAETGLVLMGEAGSYEVPLGTGETVVANMLVGTTAPTVLAKEDGEYVNYIFAKKGGVLGFYPVVDGSTLGANKAYLPLLAWKLPEEAQSRVGVFFEDENDSPGTTGVKDLNMQRANDSQVFDLQGRPVKTPRKGLYVKGNKIVKF